MGDQAPKVIKEQAERILQALMQRPSLLLEVRSRLMNVKGCGPWMNTGKRFGNRDTQNVWGLPRVARSKKEQRKFDEHPSDASTRVFVATVRPTEEWGEIIGQAHPSQWYWNVATGQGKDNGGGVENTREQAMAAAEWHLQMLGWVVLP